MGELDELLRKAESEIKLLSPKSFDNLAGLKAASLKQDISQRKVYAGKTFWFLCIFTAMVFVVLILSGFSIFNLSDSVSIALITSSFASVISIFVLVMRYLFKT